jgi:hypothetical protein
MLPGYGEGSAKAGLGEVHILSRKGTQNGGHVGY